jgi:D-alanine-D-alanine ligase
MSKLRVGLLFGGRSVEHEVSIVSARSIHRALDTEKYQIRLIAVDHQGRWYLAPPDASPSPTLAGIEVQLHTVPGAAALLRIGDPANEPLAEVDVIFPIVHGRGGEDGTLQGLLELAELPYVGSAVLGSALQMDKEVAKRLLHAAGLPVLPWLHVRAAELARGAQDAVRRAIERVGLPAFVKPANLGSSVGISRATDPDTLARALREAARYDTKILVERGIAARDVEVAILDGDPVLASIVGEIRTDREFYDYTAKYQDDTTQLLVPAPLSSELADRLRASAIEAFRALEGEGLARVDFLVDRNTEEFFVNEVNSLPGFTEVSMYPRLWEASGVPYPELLDRLIALALARQRTRAALETRYQPTP